MPLSPPAPREVLHTRAIEINGYRRSDGHYDIEARLTDTKSFGSANFDRGTIAAGEPVHDMWLRLTVDDGMHIVDCEAVSDFTPYVACPAAAPNFARLVGLRIKAGFLREANHLVGGPVGCTHLRELLQQMATTALQTIGPYRARQELAREGALPRAGSDREDRRVTEKLGGAPKMLNSCLAYAADGALVKRRWPEHYTGPEPADAAAG
jgi:hypothetical protein